MVHSLFRPERRVRARAPGRWATACGVALFAAACGSSTLAEADGRRFNVEDAARLIASHSSIPGDTQVVRVVAELWVDYTLLANHLRFDSSLRSLDVGPLVRLPLEEGMLARLSQEVVQADTVVSDEELMERFAADMPGARATASQILVPLPGRATARQRDSAFAVAQGLRGRVVAGEDFGTLAARHSGDPGSARRGGRLGTFERGQMLGPVDEAVFRLQPGDLSDPVESVLGYHILRLDALEVPDLADVGDAFRGQIQRERLAEAEAAYIMVLDSAAGLTLADNALTITRALAETSPSHLPKRAAGRPLLTWMGGAYTAGDFMTLIRYSPEGIVGQVAAATDEELEAQLRRLGRQALLIEEARARGLAPSEVRADSVAEATRSAIRERARILSLMPPRSGADPGEPEGMDPASEGLEGTAGVAQTAQARVEAALIRIVSGQQEIVPLGNVTFLLRNQGPWRINQARIEVTVERVRALRSP